MSDPLFGGDDDANRPLPHEDWEGLIPTYIALRADLNEAKQIGIANAKYSVGGATFSKHVPAAAVQAGVRQSRLSGVSA
ncbi:hypothetical protein GCM10011529_31000 [Polymorphobacter glacialis]|uniref:Uncharacterized protein n=1 Tax=Sandarakinorhabdus glacialis TaxID=1614636 RepID=A0A917A1I4_9SPHN|nr:hypothetical protein [Polymorphobacter glacialis]GGE22199.1 hypothetical protein GCM10011529_31000 [Polymorphobacter glacialis]